MPYILKSLVIILGLATAGCQAQNASTGVVNMDVGVEDFAVRVVLAYQEVGLALPESI